MFRICHHFEKRGLICKPRAVCLRRGGGAGRGAVHGWKHKLSNVVHQRTRLKQYKFKRTCNSHKLLRILIKLPPKSKVAPNGKGFQKVAPNSKSCRATCGLGYTWLMMSKAHDRTYIAELELIAAVSVNIVHVRKTLETLNRNHQVTEVVGGVRDILKWVRNKVFLRLRRVVSYFSTFRVDLMI